MVEGISGTAGIFARCIGFLAVTLAVINAVGGFLVTHRMLSMFARK
jgi:NAD(P) transhydrogenase subunit alpha